MLWPTYYIITFSYFLIQQAQLKNKTTNKSKTKTIRHKQQSTLFVYRQQTLLYNLGCDVNP